MKEYYAALYYCGDAYHPAFYLIEEGEIGNNGFRERVTDITKEVRKTLMMGDKAVPDYKIQENIYFLKYDDLISVRELRGM